MWSFGESKPVKELPRSVNDRNLIDNKFGQRLAEYLGLSMDRGPWLAGGAVRKLYLNQSIDFSDWDIWFSSAAQFECAKKLIQDLGAEVIYDSNNAITFKYEFELEDHKIQLIKRQFFDSPAQIINQFDFTVCQLITDGNQIKLGETTAMDIDRKILRSTSDQLQPYIITRMIKYIIYGYYPCDELVKTIQSQAPSINWKKSQIDYDAS